MSTTFFGAAQHHTPNEGAKIKIAGPVMHMMRTVPDIG